MNFCDATATTCDALHQVGSAQLTSAGTATVQFIPGPGSHSYKAVFAGTYSNTAGTSAASSLAVTAALNSTTTIAQSGSAGNYTLTANVAGQGAVAPSGSVSFLDTTDGNFPLGSATLAAGTPTLTVSTAQTAAVSTQPNSVVTADFNGDGIPDLAVANSGSNTISILLGNGNGTFTAAASLQTPTAPYRLAVGDFNRDGSVDLAVTLSYSNSVLIFLGNGNGAFTASPSTPATGLQPVGLAVADFNGDGLLDLAVANENSSTVTILLGNGDGTFTAASGSPAVGDYPLAIVQGDLNGDGVPDLAVANYYSNTVSILLGNGDGSFALAGSVAAGSYPSSLALADLNGDGKLDLVVSNYYSASLTVLLGKGDGTFTAAASPVTGTYPLAIGVADLNNDGKADLVVANYSNSLSVLLGNGDGTFSTSSTMLSAGSPLALAAADWNGDGIKDFAYTTSSGTLAVTTSALAQKAIASASGVSPVGMGAHMADASYAGDSVYAASVSGTTTLTAEAGAPTVMLGLSSPAITTAQVLTVTATVNGGSANAAPTGSVQLAGGGYTSGKISLSAGATTITVPAGVLALGIDSLSVGYVPDAASASIYSGASGTGSVSVTRATPSVTLIPSPSSITFAQALTVNVAVSGGQGAPAASGLVKLTSGSYSSASVALSNGAASIVIPAGTLPVGTDPLSVSYVPDTAGSALYTAATGSGSVVVGQTVPTITWAAPASIVYGTALSGTQLNATANVAGTFVYSPAAGTLPGAGSRTLSVAFTPTDTTDYATATASVPLAVTQAAPTITWIAPPAIAYGTALSSSQLSATANVAGNFVYSPAAGTIPSAGTQILRVTFTPTDTTDTNATASVSLVVNQDTPTITWATPAPIAYGTALSAAQLNATSGFAGTFVYSPAAGTIPAVRSQTLTATFTSTDSVDFLPATATVTLVDQPGEPGDHLAAITYGTALSTAQLNASSSVAGSFSYTPASGTVLAAGTQALSVTFTPADPVSYHSATSIVSLSVNKAPLLLTAATTTRPYGVANPNFTGTVAGAVNGDSFTESFSTTAGTSSVAGVYPVVPSAAGANLADYSVSATNGTLNVVPAGTSHQPDALGRQPHVHVHGCFGDHWCPDRQRKLLRRLHAAGHGHPGRRRGDLHGHHVPDRRSGPLRAIRRRRELRAWQLSGRARPDRDPGKLVDHFIDGGYRVRRADVDGRSGLLRHPADGVQRSAAERLLQLRAGFNHVRGERHHSEHHAHGTHRQCGKPVHACPTRQGLAHDGVHGGIRPARPARACLLRTAPQVRRGLACARHGTSALLRRQRPFRVRRQKLEHVHPDPDARSANARGNVHRPGRYDRLRRTDPDDEPDVGGSVEAAGRLSAIP